MILCSTVPRLTRQPVFAMASVMSRQVEGAETGAYLCSGEMQRQLHHAVTSRCMPLCEAWRPAWHTFESA